MAPPDSAPILMPTDHQQNQKDEEGFMMLWNIEK